MVHGHLNRICFIAGTPLFTPTGSQAIELFKKGDLILARNEFDPHGPLVAKRVVEVFIRRGATLELIINGKTIRTTHEHPFYVV